jgi:hypothetical protein
MDTGRVAIADFYPQGIAVIMNPAESDERVLICPQCDYNLTGLTKCRCPECGAAFDPVELQRRAELRRSRGGLRKQLRRTMMTIMTTTTYSTLLILFFMLFLALTGLLLSILM